MCESRQSSQVGHPSMSGAGTSCSHGHPTREEPPTRPCSGNMEPSGANTIRDYVVPTVKRYGMILVDLKGVKWEGFTCIPLPSEYTINSDNTATVRGPTNPPKLEECTSYLKLWAGFTNR